MKKSPITNAISFLFLISSLTGLISCQTGPATVTGLSVDSLEKADQKMQAYVDSGRLPCVSTLVLKEGMEAHRFYTGLAHIGENRPLEEDAIFRIYSMSKPVTAAALMMLYDEGKFGLDDPVAGYIPEFEQTKVWENGALVAQNEPFTIRHLLTHTAGFCYGWDQDAYVDSLYRNARSEGLWTSKTLEDLIGILAELPLKHQPGTVYEYSVSIDVAGYLAEVLSGMPFDRFLQERLFDPLGMKDTGFEVPEEDFDRLAMIYTKGQGRNGLVPSEDLTNAVKQKVTLFSGGGGMVSTIYDYGRFGQMLLNGGELDGVRVLEESTVDMIMSDQKPAAVKYEEGMGYGLGGYVDLETGAYGWSGMASTDFRADPESNMVVLAFTQYVPFMGVPFASEYQEMVREAVVDRE